MYHSYVGKSWESLVAGNSFSFEKIYTDNATVDPATAEVAIAAKHEETWAQFKPVVAAP